jgi:hypothetical protein
VSGVGGSSLAISSDSEAREVRPVVDNVSAMPAIVEVAANGYGRFVLFKKTRSNLIDFGLEITLFSVAPALFDQPNSQGNDNSLIQVDITACVPLHTSEEIPFLVSHHFFRS